MKLKVPQKAILAMGALALFLSFSDLALATAPTIKSAVANFSTHRLTITGSQFAAPTVTLDNIQLTMISSTTTSIVAQLPTISPGSYHLVVTVGTDRADLTSMSLSVPLDQRAQPGQQAPEEQPVQQAQLALQE
jgi:hypothetical protein